MDLFGSKWIFGLRVPGSAFLIPPLFFILSIRSPPNAPVHTHGDQGIKIESDTQKKAPPPNWVTAQRCLDGESNTEERNRKKEVKKPRGFTKCGYPWVWRRIHAGFR